ncbi:MAG: hypothetical protein JWN09_2868 [Microbacteriaceae bacterium]|nr:hypothetical protein [Microbacteriaceae bacterium]
MQGEGLSYVPDGVELFGGQRVYEDLLNSVQVWRRCAAECIGSRRGEHGLRSTIIGGALFPPY